MTWTRAAMCCVLVSLMTLLSSPLTTFASVEGGSAFSRVDQPLLESVFDQFSKTGLDLKNPLQVEDLHLRKDTLELHFQRGVLHLAEAIEGQVTGAFFEGEGIMILTLPNKAEKKALKHSYGEESVTEPFTEVVMRFDDGTEQDLTQSVTPAASVSGDPSATWAARNRVLYNSDNLPVKYLETRLNGLPKQGFFVADINTKNEDWLSYTFKNSSRIEVALYQESSGGAAGKKVYESWCMFHKKSDYDKKGNYTLLPEADNKDVAAVRHTTMTVEIPNTKTVNVDATIRVESFVDALRAVRFDLINNYGGSSWEDSGRPVTVEFVSDATGTPLPYIHKQHQLLVLLPEPLARGQTTEIHVKAAEDTIIQLTPNSYLIYNTYAWFPQMGQNGGRYTIDWTIKVAKPMRAAASGGLVREWEEGKMNCGQWKSSRPVQFPSFIFGEFKVADEVYEREGDSGGTVPLRIYTIKGGRAAIKGKMGNIFFNIRQGIKNYESIFGAFPYEGLDITQMPKGMGFGQSPPGILFLTGSALEGGGGGGSTDQFIFHELAHQWWGNQVGSVGPEDTWISESWAEYSAGLLTEAIEPKRFKEMCESWKQDAFEADPEGTIATAYHSSERTRLLYAKGPYIVHMLRTWLGWEKFTELTNLLQTKYRDSNINTDTIAREASKLMGYDMFPFFDQWIRDQGIPKIRYAWSTSKTDDGKFIVTIKLRQEDADNFKILMLPITFDFGKGDPVVVSKPMLKPITEVKLKVPMRPKDVRLDDQNTQLATIAREGE